MKPAVFLSFPVSRREAALALAAALARAGLSVYAPPSPRTAQTLTAQLRRDAARRVLVLWCAQAKDCGIVAADLAHARAAGKLAMVRFDETSARHVGPVHSDLSAAPLQDPDWTPPAALLQALSAEQQPPAAKPRAAPAADRRVTLNRRCIHNVRAKDSTGRQAFYVVFVEPRHEPAFLKALQGSGTFDLETFGRVLASNYGDGPNEAVRRLMRERYGVEV